MAGSVGKMCRNSFAFFTPDDNMGRSIDADNDSSETPFQRTSTVKKAGRKTSSRPFSCDEADKQMDCRLLYRRWKHAFECVLCEERSLGSRLCRLAYEAHMHMVSASLVTYLIRRDRVCDSSRLVSAFCDSRIPKRIAEYLHTILGNACIVTP